VRLHTPGGLANRGTQDEPAITATTTCWHAAIFHKSNSTIKCIYNISPCPGIVRHLVACVAIFMLSSPKNISQSIQVSVCVCVCVCVFSVGQEIWVFPQELFGSVSFSPTDFDSDLPDFTEKSQLTSLTRHFKKLGPFLCLVFFHRWT